MNKITSQTSPTGEFLCLDFGLKRIGLARINSQAKIAEYLAVLERQTDDQAIQQVLELAKDLQSDGLVVGLPRGLDGQSSQQTILAAEFIQKLAEKSSKPVYAIDEAGTSRAAEQRGDYQDNLDSVAAGIIGEDFVSQTDISNLLVKPNQFLEQFKI